MNRIPASRACLIKVLPFPISPHIPIKDINVPVGIFFFELQSRMHRMGAAHPAAIGMIRFPRAHALDKDDGLGLSHLRVAGGHFLVQLQMGYDPRVLTIKIFPGLKFLGPGGDDRHPVFQFGGLTPIIGAHYLGGELADKPVHGPDLMSEVGLDLGVFLDPPDRSPLGAS